MGPEDLHISAYREAGRARLGQNDAQMRHRAKPVTQDTCLQDDTKKYRCREQHQGADPFIGVTQTRSCRPRYREQPALAET